MNTFKRSLLLLASIVCCAPIWAQSAKQAGLAAMTDQSMLAQLRFLSSDYMEGRQIGEKGELFAANYIASVFEMAGLKPAGDMVGKTRSYFQKIPVVLTAKGDRQSLRLVVGGERYEFAANTDYFIPNLEVTKQFTAPVVFAGYGMIDNATGYNDFAGLDVKGKVVVRIKGFPGHTDTLSTAYSKFKLPANSRMDARVQAGTRYLQEKGAVAVIEILPQEQYLQQFQRTAENTTHYPSERLSASSGFRMTPARPYLVNTLPVISVSPRLGAALLQDTPVEVAAFEKTVARTLKPQSVVLPGKQIDFESEVTTKNGFAYNVLAMIEGEDTTQNVVIGAHYDHLGINKNQIWNGADDNASGTVALMAIGEAFKATGTKPRCNVIFAAWTGEEIGFLGSRYFVDNFPKEQIKLNINYDMIGREITDKSNEVTLRYMNTHPLLGEYGSNNVKEFGLPLTLTVSSLAPGVGGSTDFAPFSAKGIPFIAWKAGHRDDYHRPGDDFAKINYNLFCNIIRLGFLTAWDVANKPIEYVK